MKYLTLVLILFTGLFFGRPSQAEHKQHLENEGARIIGVNPEELGYQVGVNLITANNVTIVDYYLFTLGYYKGVWISTGVLRSVHVQTKHLTFKLLEI